MREAPTDEVKHAFSVNRALCVGGSRGEVGHSHFVFLLCATSLERIEQLMKFRATQNDEPGDLKLGEHEICTWLS